MHVLLVEDDPMSRKLVRDVLGEVYSFDESHTLDGAKLRLKERRFDCCLLDLNLPDSVGEDTYDALRSAAPNLPIVVLSGMEPELLERIRKKGASSCLLKGATDMRELSEALQRSVNWITTKHTVQTEIRSIKDQLPSIIAALALV